MILINVAPKKLCFKCGKNKFIGEFCRCRRASGNGYRAQSHCKECNAKYQHAHLAQCNITAKRCIRKVHDAVLDALGGKCSCCREKRRNFLSLEHIKGGGGKHRKSLGNGYSYWKSVLDAGCPKDEYTVLCYNCNLSRGFYGYCCRPLVVTTVLITP